MIDLSGSITNFLILFPIVFGLSFIFFYIRKLIKVRKYKQWKKSQEV